MRGLVIARSHPVTTPKDAVEVGAIVKPGGEGRLLDGYLGHRQKLAGAFKTVSQEIAPERGTMLFREDAAEMGRAYVTGHRRMTEAQIFGEALFDAGQRRGGSRRGSARSLSAQALRLGRQSCGREAGRGRRVIPCQGQQGADLC